MNLTKFLLLGLMLIGTVAAGKFKLVAINRPHFGFLGVKVRKPKLLGLKHAFGGGLGGHGGFGGGGHHHSSGYEHHEYHESHHSSHDSHGFGGWLGR